MSGRWRGAHRPRLGTLAAAALGSILLTATTLAPVEAVTLAAVPDSYTINHDRLLSVPAPGVLSNDVTLLGSPTVELVSDVANGTLALEGDGGFSYTPNPGFVGSDSFRYRARDGLLESSAIVTLSVTNAAPVAADDLYTAKAGVPKVIVAPGVLLNDSDADGDRLKARLIGGPKRLIDLHADGSITFRASGSFAGDATFTYRVTDGLAWSSEATITIRVEPRPDPTSPPATPTPTRPASTSTGEPPSEPAATGQGPTPSPDRGAGHFAVPPVDPFAPIEGIGTVELAGFDWAVPSLVLSVPGLLLILAVIAQAAAGLLSVPVVRRSLAGLGLQRRRRRPPATGD